MEERFITLSIRKSARTRFEELVGVQGTRTQQMQRACDELEDLRKQNEILTNENERLREQLNGGETL